MKRPAEALARQARVVVLGMILIALSLAAPGCGDDAVGQPGGTAVTTIPGGPALTSVPGGPAATSVPGGPAAAYQVVTFQTEDGLTLSGRLYGSGTKGVLLAHMYPADQTSWDSVAQRLAAEGYLVLTFDFRGYGKSEGKKDIQYLDRDVMAAVMYLRGAGAEQAVLAGASMGGTAGLKAAGQLQLFSSFRLAGVVTLSAPVEFKGLSARALVPNLVVPLLFIAADNDEGAEGARELQTLSGGKGQLEILPGGEHGTALFEGSQADQVWTLLLDFMRENMPPAVE
jgi:pimeloyl-ACP methyl ester carboxylesterase